MAPPVRTAEQKLARLATEAYGVATRAELLAAGLSTAEIKHRLRIGSLIREHPGVYRVGHTAPSAEALYLAATKAAGPGAVLSGRSAAWLLGILKGRPPPPEVTGPRQRRLAGVRTRRSRRMDALEITVWRGIPVTSVAQTVVDLAGMLPEAELARVCHEAGVRHKTTPAHLEAVLARRRSPGAQKLRRVMNGDTRVTLSALERRFLARLCDEGLVLPQTNRVAGGRRVDCRWPGHGLTVELDGYRYHRSRHAREQDRRREREAYARGDDFRRYTYGDVFEAPARMLSELRSLLC